MSLPRLPASTLPEHHTLRQYRTWSSRSIGRHAASDSSSTELVVAEIQCTELPGLGAHTVGQYRTARSRCVEGSGADLRARSDARYAPTSTVR
eukprot:1678009-Rhodomonas_salina.3